MLINYKCHCTLRIAKIVLFADPSTWDVFTHNVSKNRFICWHLMCCSKQFENILAKFVKAVITIYSVKSTISKVRGPPLFATFDIFIIAHLVRAWYSGSQVLVTYFRCGHLNMGLKFICRCTEKCVCSGFVTFATESFETRKSSRVHIVSFRSSFIVAFCFSWSDP